MKKKKKMSKYKEDITNMMVLKSKWRFKITFTHTQQNYMYIKSTKEFRCGAINPIRTLDINRTATAAASAATTKLQFK